MGLFFGKETRSNPLTDPNHPVWSNVVSRRTAAGVNVSEENSIKYLTVLACVTLLSGDIGGLPLILYKRNQRSRERAVDHPCYALGHDQANPEMAAFTFKEAGQGHATLWGNHYSVIERNRYTGQVKALWPIKSPGGVEILRDDRNRLVYKWRDENGKQQERFKKDIFHVPGFSFDGIKGLSSIALARETIGFGLSMEEFGARFFGQGMNMAGIISLESGLGDSEGAYMAKLKEQYAGLGNSHGLMVLSNGEKYERLSIPMADAQFIESRKFQKIEICGMYHIPPHKIGIYEKNTNRSNTEQENQSYIDTALMHWIRRWESAFNLQVLTEADRKAGFYYEFLLDALLRGDSTARANYYTKRWQIGSMSSNDIREKENENPVEGGDEYFVPLNFIPASRIEEMEYGSKATGTTDVPSDRTQDEPGSADDA